MTFDHTDLALAANFHDMGQYSDAVGWDLDIRQVDAGPLNASVKAVTMAFDMILNVGFNRKFHQIGCAPKGLLTFGIPNSRVEEFLWCAARGGALLNFNQDGGLEGTSPAGFDGYTFSFDTDALQTFAAGLCDSTCE